jgi:N-methylhydantoinase B
MPRGHPGQPALRTMMKMKRQILGAADRTFFANLLSGIADEMGVALMRTAYSPNIKERKDFSCAVFDHGGRMIAQAAHIPVHLGAMPMSVTAALKKFPDLGQGDIVALNDPFCGGTHLPDLTLVAAVFAESDRRRPIAYLANRAHHSDVGGMAPGSMPLSREIYQEGLRIPPVKLVKRGEENSELLELLQANVRTPAERLGDLRAQIAAIKLGQKRIREVCAKYGAQSIEAAMAGLFDYGRQLMQALLKTIPNGSYSFTDYLDDDGIGNRHLKIKAKIIIKGTRTVVDFKGTDDECPGGLNAVEAVTRSAVYYCFCGLLVTMAADPDSGLPPSPLINGGCFEPIEVIARPGCLVNARPPRGVAAGNTETSQRIVDVVLGALAQVLPALVPAASQGTMNNLTLGGETKNGEHFAYYETIGGGSGAGQNNCGADAIHVHMTNTGNTPAEALEYAYPLRVERYEIRTGSGGAGKQRGGCGIRRDIRALCDCRGTLVAERRKIAPYGLAGGKPGRKGRDLLIRNGKQIILPGKLEVELKSGDLLSIRTPGGGGWGTPDKKHPRGDKYYRKELHAKVEKLENQGGTG